MKFYETTLTPEEIVARLRKRDLSSHSYTAFQVDHYIDHDNLDSQAADLIEKLMSTIAQERSGFEKLIQTFDSFDTVRDTYFNYFVNAHRNVAIEEFANKLIIEAKNFNIFRKRGTVSINEIGRILEQEKVKRLRKL